MIDWNKISPKKFESLCAELLELNGFKNIQWFGNSGGDKGRDLTATKQEEPISGIQLQRRWIVQCKRYVRKNLEKRDLENLLASTLEHTPDALLLILTRPLTSNLKDWLDAVKSTYKFDIYLWEDHDLEREISKHRSRLKTKIAIKPTPGKALLFSSVSYPGVFYLSDFGGQFEEVGFHMMNDYGPKENIEILKRFVDHIRHNEIDFEIGDEDKDE